MSLFGKEKQFPLSDIRLSLEAQPPAVHRHYIVLADAMEREIRPVIDNRQRRLLHGGYEVPITLKHCKTILERYTNGS